MNEEDDELLRKLGKLARAEAMSEPDLLDERWDRLAAGTLSAEEETELRRLAAASLEDGYAYEAFRPLGADFHGKVAAAIAAQASAGAESQRDDAPAAVTGGTLLPFRRTARRLAVLGAALGAAAAAIVGLLVRLPPLPAYQLAELTGGSRSTRGELVEAPQLAPGDRFQAVLRPMTAVRRPSSLRAEAYLIRAGELRRVEVESEVDAGGGSVRVSGQLDGELPAGSWTLWLVVGRRGSLPKPAEVRAFSIAGPVSERNWAALPKALQIQPRAPD